MKTKGTIIYVTDEWIDQRWVTISLNRSRETAKARQGSEVIWYEGESSSLISIGKVDGKIKYWVAERYLWD